MHIFFRLIILSLVASLGISAGWCRQLNITQDFKKPGSVAREDWDLATGKRVNQEDLRCREFGHYIGGIDRTWWLIISGPPRKRFSYFFEGLEKVEISGTYQVKNGMVQFTGTLVRGPAAFGGNPDQPRESKPFAQELNHASLGDDVYFNLLKRTEKGAYTYRRQWLQAAGKDKWSPREEHQLTFHTDKKEGKKWTFRVTGLLRRWDKAGKVEDSRKLDELVTYQSQEGGRQWYREGNQGDYLPRTLKLEKIDLNDPAIILIGGPVFGWARGFAFEEPPAWKNP